MNDALRAAIAKILQGKEIDLAFHSSPGLGYIVSIEDLRALRQASKDLNTQRFHLENDLIKLCGRLCRAWGDGNTEEEIMQEIMTCIGFPGSRALPLHLHPPSTEGKPAPTLQECATDVANEIVTAIMSLACSLVDDSRDDQYPRNYPQLEKEAVSLIAQKLEFLCRSRDHDPR